MYNYNNKKLLGGRNQNDIYSTATPPTKTTKGSTRSAKTREVENVVAAKFASIAENCGGTTVTDHLFPNGVLVRRNTKREIDSGPK